MEKWLLEKDRVLGIISAIAYSFNGGLIQL